MKDWVGNKNSIYKTLGATSHTKEVRQQDDYYATDPAAVDHLLELVTPSRHIWECACGEGHLSRRLLELGYDVFSTDLIYRGFGMGGRLLKGFQGLGRRYTYKSALQVR